jgi:DNA replication ATP-dependent helicase Dna2
MRKRALVEWKGSQNLPAVIPKKIKTSAASSALSFWYKECTNPLNSDDIECVEAEPPDELEAFITSTEHNAASLDTGRIECSKFVVNSVKRERDHVVLAGDGIECYVSGEWAEESYTVNRRVSVLNCLCCPGAGGDSDLSFLDSVFSSEENDTEANALDMSEEKASSSVKRLYVTNEEGYLIIEDDLMAVTSYCSALSCINNPYIKAKVADINFGYSELPLLLGVIIHTVLERALVEKDFSLKFLVSQVKLAISQNVMLMYACNTGEKAILNEILRLLRNIHVLQDYRLNVSETEKRLFSLLFNIKGNADAIGEEIILEIKNSRIQKIEHRAQAMLYSLILKEKTNLNFKSYLYYVPTRSLVEVGLRHREVVSLLRLRNRLALQDCIEECQCDGTRSCKIIARIARMDRSHFLRKQWEAIETEELEKRKAAFVPAKFKSQRGTHLILSVEYSVADPKDSYVSLLNAEFVRLCKGVVERREYNRLWIRLSEDISLREQKKLYIYCGSSELFYKFMRFSLLHIAYPRYLQRGSNAGFFLPGEKEGFPPEISTQKCSDMKVRENGIFSTDESGIRNPLSSPRFTEEDSLSNVPVQRVEEDISSMDGCSISENVIFADSMEDSFEMSHMSNEEVQDAGGVTKYLDRLSGAGLSREADSSLSTSSDLKKDQIPIPECYRADFMRLNEDQRSALFLALNCKNYRIIHGMPGTGKSTLIALLIKILVFLKKKVLLVCYTNLALTNLIERLPGINIYRARKETLDFKTTDEARVFYGRIDVVAGTCFSLTDPVFINRRFDFCLIDEGSQQHLLLSLLPVSLSDRFVIVGDHLQLKPLSKCSKELGLSLFEYLMGDNCSKLRTQYRMGTEIMRLSNTLFYNNELCGEDRPSTVEFVDTSATELAIFIESLHGCSILCYFNAQVESISRITECVVETVDRYQGSEADKVVVIFDPVSKCEVMESSERLNVAITRAKRHLVLVGNREKMAGIRILRRLLDAI